MSQIKETVFIVVGAAFAILGIWQIGVPINEETVLQLVEILFAILGSIGIGVGLRGKRVAKKALQDGAAEVNGLRVGYIGKIEDKK